MAEATSGEVSVLRGEAQTATTGIYGESTGLTLNDLRALLAERDQLSNSLRLAANLVDENQFGDTVDVDELRQAIGHYPDADA